MKCEKCGAEIEGKFCSNCGSPAPIADESTTKIKCGQCGTEYSGKFCPNCGESAPADRTNSKSEAAPSSGKKSKKKSKSKKPLFKRPLFIIIVALLLAIVIAKAFGNGDDVKSEQSDLTETSSPVETNSSDDDANTTPEPEKSDSSSELDANGLRPEFKEAMDSYEAFMDEYVEFMKAYEQNPSDLTLLAKYADYMVKYSDLCDDFDKWDDEEMNDAETSYYIAVQSRVTQKLLEVAG